MKKLLFFAVSVFLLAACGGNKDNKIQDFANSFATYVNNGQIDSIKVVYPTANFDSVAPISTDSISISEIGKGEYKINFSSDRWLKVKLDFDGKLKVQESQGIAAFPADKYETGMKSGMFSDDPTDVEIYERLNDSDFFIWLKEKAANAQSNIVSLTPGSISYNSKMGYDAYDDPVRQYQAVENVTVTNNSSTHIKGSDYNISYVYKLWTCCDNEGWWSKNKTVSGVDLAPGESKSISLTSEYDEWGKKPKIENPKINFKASQEDAAKFYQPSGNEYQEYLNANKSKSSAVSENKENNEVEASNEIKASNEVEKKEINIQITPGKLRTIESDYSESWTATMTVTLKNLTDSPVSGNDYSISYKSKEWGGGSEDPTSKTVTRTEKGINLGPNEVGHITISRKDADKFYDFKIKRK